MIVEPPASVRFETSDTPEALCVDVHPRRHWGVILVMAALVVGWSGGLVTLGVGLTRGQIKDPVLPYFLAAIAVMCVVFLYRLIVVVSGRQRLTVRADVLEVADVVCGFARVKQYATQHIKAFHVVVDPPSPWTRAVPFNWPVGIVTFDYGAATISIVPGLTPAEGRMIVQLLTARGLGGSVAV